MSYAVCRFSLILALLVTATAAQAQIPTILTDTIKQGDGVIDVIQDVSPASLQDYLSDGTVFLGVDVNEDASGLEKASSQGVAIKEVELLIQTTAGDFSFTSFYTNGFKCFLSGFASIHGILKHRWELHQSHFRFLK